MPGAIANRDVDLDVMTAEQTDLLATPLTDRHVALGARMVPFAGYAMPVQYPTGILTEHTKTRESAGLFDVSHMGQAMLIAADGRHETAAAALEALVPADILTLSPGRQRYTQLLNDEGGIRDDLMVTRSVDPADDGILMLVVNAACKTADYEHIARHLPSGVSLEPVADRGLIAVQGPKASAVVSGHIPGAGDMAFMTGRSNTFDGADVHVSRSGYTGEDGYELSVPAAEAERIWDALLGHPGVTAVGLGARDSLRLEAGLCLYGHDIDETTSPVEAGLLWSIQKRRRQEGGFPGAERIMREIAEGPSRRLVGLAIEGRAPVREGATVSHQGEAVGTVTSGGFGPSVGGPVAMGYVRTELSGEGTPLDVELRGRTVAAAVKKLPFIAKRFAK